MKAEIELIFADGKSCLHIRNHDKNQSLDQQLLKHFLDLAIKNGLDIFYTGGMTMQGESWKEYKIIPKTTPTP